MWADGRTDRHDEADSRFSQLRERSHKPSTHLFPTLYTFVSLPFKGMVEASPAGCVS